MATTTARFALTLPDPADTVDITQINNDMTAIDNALGFTPCTSSTRPSSPADGQAIYERDTDRFYVWDDTDPGVWQLVGPMTAATTGATTMTSNASLTAVAELALPLAPQTRYALDGFLAYSSAPGADAQIGLSLPAGSTLLLSTLGPPASATSGTGGIDAGVVTSGAVVLGGGGVGVTLAAPLRGIISTGPTAGPMQLTFAQAVPTASATVLGAGSWVSLRRI